jgi:hypothetical protein
MSFLLPEPKTLRDITLMYGLNKLFTSKRNLIGKSFTIDMHLDKLKAGKVISPNSLAFDRINMYFLNHAMHQVNEACNKLWATAELLHAAKSNKRLCKKFCEEFVPSSAVPTLHYANISALLSILSLFGVSLIAQRGKRLTFYNVVRTSKGVVMAERNKYLSAVFGSVKRGWHAQILQTYDGLHKKGVMLPEVDLQGSDQLLKERLKFDYDILGQTSMRGVYGVQNYFKLFPTAIASINQAIKSIHQVTKPIPNGCDLRFEELVNNFTTLLQTYKMKPII